MKLNNKSIAEPEKELRFTRAAQASLFFFLGVISTMVCIGTLFNEFVNWGLWHPEFKEHWWFSLIALMPAAIFFRIGLHCIRHAYLILTPLGVEIFPFWKPEKNLQLIFWSDIDHAVFSDHTMTLHFNKEETSGVVITLRPIGKSNYPLLHTAMLGRLKKSEESN